jgi:N-dimethylarginine dimethylaminohydrolase
MGSEPEQRASDEALIDLAVTFLCAIMRSASTDKIRPVDWWVRAKAALETAAGTAEAWSHLVSRAAEKVEIEALSAASSRSIFEVGEVVAVDAVTFMRFRSLCERDAIFIAAMAQTRREEERDQAAATKGRHKAQAAELDGVFGGGAT